MILHFYRPQRSCGKVMFFPPANEVWGKVIFLHLFVILFTGGCLVRGVWSGGACLVPGGCLIPGGAWSGGVPAPGGCLVLGGPPKGSRHPRPGSRRNACHLTISFWICHCSKKIFKFDLKTHFIMQQMQHGNSYIYLKKG